MCTVLQCGEELEEVLLRFLRAKSRAAVLGFDMLIVVVWVLLTEVGAI